MPFRLVFHQQRVHLSAERRVEPLQTAGYILMNGGFADSKGSGGGSDGNFISHYGVATLDGCGPCGGKLHTREEYLMTKTVEQRLDLMYVLLTRLFRRCPD